MLISMRCQCRHLHTSLIPTHGLLGTARTIQRCGLSDLLNPALKYGNGIVYVSVSEALTASNIHDVFPDFHILDPDSPPPVSLSSEHSASLSNSSYVAGTWLPLESARKNFKLEKMISAKNNGSKNKLMLQQLEGLEGGAAFDTWVAACARIDSADAHESMNTVDEVISVCLSKIKCSKS